MYPEDCVLDFVILLEANGTTSFVSIISLTWVRVSDLLVKVLHETYFSLFGGRSHRKALQDHGYPLL
jgi:hypothetical protein